MKQLFIKAPAVMARYSLSRSTLWRMVRDGRFPPATQLGVRSVAWHLPTLEAWEQSRMEAK